MLGECHISFFILSSLYFYLTISILGRYSNLGVSAILHISFYPPYIGIYYFKNLIPDEELIILKAELQLYRNHNFYAEISPHVVNASSAR